MIELWYLGYKVKLQFETLESDQAHVTELGGEAECAQHEYQISNSMSLLFIAVSPHRRTTQRSVQSSQDVNLITTCPQLAGGSTILCTS